MYPSLMSSFFAPPTIIVVSEERLQKAELEQKQRQLEQLDERIAQLENYRGELAKEVENLDQPQSLEEALLGE
jgi:cell division protein FtsB